ncbi:serine hydrolase domain-containing protein [Kineosporia rhizophila]|uniref:serine hydrolase domain-containing protein n=1 Tax=Kineosporia rhizophila TaxID=84633 RepID=UPI002FCDB40A
MTGQELPELVDERISGPLGLKKTYLPETVATNIDQGYARGYSMKFDGALPEYTDTAAWPIDGRAGAAGAMISDQDDLAVFVSALFAGKLFSDEQLTQLKTVVDLPAAYRSENAYGLGVHKVVTPCGTVWGLRGQTDGHQSFAVATEDGKRTAVSDVTAVPYGDEWNDGMRRWSEVTEAAEVVTLCQMLGKAAPASVGARLRGTPG